MVKNELFRKTAKQLIKEGLAKNVPESFEKVADFVNLVNLPNVLQKMYHESSETFKQLIVERYWETLMEQDLLNLVHLYHYSNKDDYFKSIIAAAVWYNWYESLNAANNSEGLTTTIDVLNARYFSSITNTAIWQNWNEDLNKKQALDTLGEIITCLADKDTSINEYAQTYNKYFEYDLISLNNLYRNSHDILEKQVIMILFAYKVFEEASILELVEQHEVCPPQLNFLIEYYLKKLTPKAKTEKLIEYLDHSHLDLDYIFIRELAKRKAANES